MCLERGCLGRSGLCMSGGSGRSKSGVLFELAICKAGGLCSCVEQLFGDADQILLLHDLVVGLFHLNSHLFLGLDETELGFREQCLRVLDFGVAPPTVKEIVSERESEAAEVVYEEWDSALVAVSRQPGNIRDVRVLRC